MADNQQKTSGKVTAKDLHVAHEQMLMTAIVLQALHLKGKYIKQVLTRIEADGMMTAQVRKNVLDGFNEWGRDLELLLTEQ